ncbi:MAG: carboxypeptidase regulatory-like domain-containing protein, partial [Anaerolineae bacterium]
MVNANEELARQLGTSSTAEAVPTSIWARCPTTRAFLQRIVLGLVIALLGWLTIRPGQTVYADTAGFRGQVTDVLTKQPIRGAVVTAGGTQTTTDADGRYLLRLAPGTYEVSVQAAGYIGMSKSYQKVRSNTYTNVDFAMVLAAPSVQQRTALDALLRQPVETKFTDEELTTMQISGFQPSGITRLPATIRVLMPDNTVVVMPFDEYIKGVLPKEMPPHWPMEALKAQAVAARCY